MSAREPPSDPVTCPECGVRSDADPRAVYRQRRLWVWGPILAAVAWVGVLAGSHRLSSSRGGPIPSSFGDLLATETVRPPITGADLERIARTGEESFLLCHRILAEQTAWWLPDGQWAPDALLAVHFGDGSGTLIRTTEIGWPATWFTRRTETTFADLGARRGQRECETIRDIGFDYWHAAPAFPSLPIRAWVRSQTTSRWHISSFGVTLLLALFSWGAGALLARRTRERFRGHGRSRERRFAATALGAFLALTLLMTLVGSRPRDDEYFSPSVRAPVLHPSEVITGRYVEPSTSRADVEQLSQSADGDSVLASRILRTFSEIDPKSHLAVAFGQRRANAQALSGSFVASLPIVGNWFTGIGAPNLREYLHGWPRVRRAPDPLWIPCGIELYWAGSLAGPSRAITIDLAALATMILSVWLVWKLDRVLYALAFHQRVTRCRHRRLCFACNYPLPPPTTCHDVVGPATTS